MAKIRARKESGLLYFDFMYKGKRCREQTILTDTAANRRQMERALAKIEAAITLGQFNYLEYFPQSRRGHKLSQGVESSSTRTVATIEVSTVDTPTFGEFAETWLAENKVRWRKATYDSQVGQLNKHVLPRFASKRLNAITKAELLAFRGDLAN